MIGLFTKFMHLKSGLAVAVSQHNFGSTAQKWTVSLFQTHVDCWGFRGSSWDQHQLFTLLAINCREQSLVWWFVFYCPHISAPESIRLVSTCELKSYSCSQLVWTLWVHEETLCSFKKKALFPSIECKISLRIKCVFKREGGTNYWS